MLVRDIIRDAATKSGVVPSYNPDEIPPDIMARGHDLLAGEVLKGLNCNRMIDITTTVKKYTPEFVGNNESQIVLQPTPNSWKGFVLGTVNDLPAGHTPLTLTASHLTAYDDVSDQYTNWIAAITTMNDVMGLFDEHPRDDEGEPLNIGLWSADNYFVVGTYTEENDNVILQSVAILWSNGHPVNIEFAPMYIRNILEASNRFEYNYLYPWEFESIDFVHTPYCYCTEERKDFVKIRMRNPGAAKLLVLPVPLTIERTTEDYYGEINAPDKFKPYLTAYLAYLLAVEYGVGTKDDMLSQMTKTYNLIKLNKKPEIHKMSSSRQIRDTLNRGCVRY